MDVPENLHEDDSTNTTVLRIQVVDGTGIGTMEI
jgi:hypothetical protein